MSEIKDKETVTIDSIFEDLAKFYIEYGAGFTFSVCAVIINEFCWWNWQQLKHEIRTDAELQQLINGETKTLKMSSRIPL